jgi:hypothetical protein
MNKTASWIGQFLATYLTKEIEIKGLSPPSNPLHLQETLVPGDVLLVEGNSRISGAIKFLTHSTWSHAALYVGYEFSNLYPSDCCLIESDILRGVCFTSLEKYAGYHTRICRPIGLYEHECIEVIQYAISQIGHQYDLRNIFDLVRYLLPNPPVPAKYRRQLLELGSGDPTRAICSTLIAQAFQKIHYPILPANKSKIVNNQESSRYYPREFSPKHYSFITPRDFDVSPYFDIIKPTAESGFNFHDLEWVG